MYDQYIRQTAHLSLDFTKWFWETRLKEKKGDKLKITLTGTADMIYYFSEKYPSTVYFAAVAMTISMTVCMNVVMVSKNIIFYHCTNCINFYWTMYLCIRRSTIFLIAIFFLPVHIAFTNLLMKQTCNVLVYMYIYC